MVRVRPWRGASPVTPPGRFALTAAVLAVGLTASVAVVLGQQNAQRRLADEALARRTDLVRTAVENEIARYSSTLLDLAAAIGAQDHLAAADFDAVTASVTQGRLSGATGISFVVPARSGEIDRVQREWRARGSTGIELRPAPDPPDAEHRFVVLSRSLDPTSTILGRDTTASAESTEAMTVARATGRVAASRTYVLLRDRDLPPDQQQLSFVLTAPVYGAGAAADRGTFRGWVLMGLRGGDFLAELLRDITQYEVDVSLLDTSTDGQTIPVAAWPAGAGTRTGEGRTVVATVAQRRWTIVVHPTGRLIGATQSYLPAVFGAAGVGISVLSALLVFVLANARRRALDRVAEATAALQADIVRRQRVEDELRRREEELSRFAGVVAHDLRSPLAVATGFVELIRQDHQLLDDDHRHYLAVVDKSLHRMRRLIEDLLAFATAEHVRIDEAPVDLAEVVAEVLAERTAHLAPADRPEVDIGPLPRLTGDPALLRQVLDNLLGNAFKYTAPGQPARVSVTAEPGPDGWRIEIADRGIGIPAGQHAAVFDPFRRAGGSERYPGTGLGLAICKRIVERHGGHIGAGPNPGGGTRFTIDLPGRPAPAELAHSAA
jgi:signal transduction histidine kinase